MIRFFFLLLLLTATLAQMSILPQMEPIQVLPDITLVLLLVWSALRGVPEGLIWAFGLGFLFDVIALDPLGTNALALLGVALLGGLAARRFFHSNLVFPIVLSVAATMLHAVVLLLLRSGDGAGLPIGSVFRLVFLQALLNSLFVPPIYFLASRMERRMDLAHA